MNGLKAWSIAICMAALGCAAIRLLAPKAGSGKLFSLITSSFFLCALLLPAFQLFSLPSLEVELLPESVVSELLAERVQTQLHEQVESAVTALVETALRERGITAEKVDVITDISEDGGIYMQQVTVQVDTRDAPQAAVIREGLEAQLQTTVVIETKE